MMEQPRERVIEQIARAGLSEQDASALVSEAWRAGRGDRRGEGRTEIVRGSGMIVAGLAASLLLSSLLGSFGIRLLFWGIVLYGIFDVINGVRKLSS
jgi:hypothetical protein